MDLQLPSAAANLDPYRARLYRLLFALAALYNLAFGLWVGLWPGHFFELLEMPTPNYPEIWQCLGMVIGLYGVGYAYAAWRLDRGRPLIAIGLAGKVFGPIGFLLTAGQGNWPWRAFTMNMFNDLIWWVPFSLYLLEGTRLAQTIRAWTPPICAVLNAAAALGMLLVLKDGTEAVPEVAQRVAYIVSHLTWWRAGWACWCMAAISLIGLFAWWGARIASPAWAMAAFLVGIVGLMFDLFFESLFIGWLPDDYERIYPIGAWSMGVGANGCYSLAGIMLTIQTSQFTRFWRLWSWSVWISGLALVLAVWFESVPATIVATAVMMALFCPWAALLPWKLPLAESSSPAG